MAGTAFGDRWLGFAEEEVFDWLEQAGFRSPETARFPVDNGLTIGLYRAEKR